MNTRIRYRPEGMEEARRLFAALKAKTAEWRTQLPTTYEYLKAFHQKEATDTPRP